MSSATVNSRRKQKPSLLSGGKVWFVAAATVAVIVVVGVFTIVSQFTQKTTYYVLNQDVSARTQITASMLTPVETSAGGAPRTALNIADVQKTYTAARYALKAGDVVTLSNSGVLDPISQGVPSDYVIASFSVPVENAVAGKVSRGDYIDVTATETSTNSSTGAGGAAKVFLRHVIVLDASADLSSSNTTTANSSAVDAQGNPVGAADANAARGGVPTLYTVALSPQDAAKLAYVTSTTLPMNVFLSASGDTATAPADISADRGSVFDGQVGDSGAGTDPAFGQENNNGVTTNQ